MDKKKLKILIFIIIIYYLLPILNSGFFSDDAYNSLIKGWLLNNNTNLIDKMIRESDLGFLGREKKFTECGLYSMNLRDKITQEFLVEFQKAYDSGRLFTFQEWNDCWVFDEVRKEIRNKNPQWRLNDWCKGLIKGEGHPLINSEWGAYLDHLKGRRKDQGKSAPKDLIVRRSERYWR